MAFLTERKTFGQKVRSTLKVAGRIAGGSLGLGTVVVGVDMLLSGSVYLPLFRLYQAGSWALCLKSTCPTSTPGAIGKAGMVVTEQKEASAVGLRVLQSGGNAVDAAVAIGYALAVTYPCCGNLGGGGFMLIRQADGTSKVINFREKAPLAATPQMFLDPKGQVQPERSKRGYLAVGVPGTVAGLDWALTHYGSLPRRQVMAPAIELAETGFILQSADADLLQQGMGKFKQQPNVAAIFLKDGQPYKTGDRLIQKHLAQTLRQIASQGASAFYRGSIADTVVRESRARGGILSLQDFQSYRVSEAEPLRCRYRGYEVMTTPLPGGGVTVCQMLTLLNGYDLNSLSKAESLHLMLQSMLLAYADRNRHLGDPQFVQAPVNQLLSPNYAAQHRQRIQPQQAISPESLYLERGTEGDHTTHYSVVDRFGNAVSVTYTINSFYGAEVMAGDTGFFLNNEMDDFAIKPGTANQFGLVQGAANAIAPEKRPLSSMAPTIVLKQGKPWIVTGSPGGSTISTTLLQVISRVVDQGLPLEQAVSAPRIHFQGLPNVVVTEPYALNTDTNLSLWRKGYRVVPFQSWGAAETIMIEPGLLQGMNDPRKPAGRAIGY
jgi:gamma-glutamyltranspeptidase / glutathione hydrolase